jgi:hypothetical protein
MANTSVEETLSVAAKSPLGASFLPVGSQILHHFSL